MRGWPVSLRLAEADETGRQLFICIIHIYLKAKILKSIIRAKRMMSISGLENIILGDPITLGDICRGRSCMLSVFQQRSKQLEGKNTLSPHQVDAG